MKRRFKHIIFRFAPKPVIDSLKRIKKKYRNQRLAKQAQKGGVSKDDMLTQLKTIGINEGDVVLVHSALSKIGYVSGGAQSVVEALLEAVGETGHVLMPNSPNNGRQLDYIRQLECFDVLNSPSKLGAISEYFRKLPQAKRSIHPTEPVSCIGPDSAYFVDAHMGQLTPYNEYSPFYRVAKRSGKILMIGVTLDNAGTNLHCLEDAVAFQYPVYYDQIFTVNVKDENGVIHKVQTKVHNPEWSSKRKCDELLPLFEKEGVLTYHKLGEAKVLLFDAQKMLTTMIEMYTNHGITMYHPSIHVK